MDVFLFLSILANFGQCASIQNLIEMLVSSPNGCCKSHYAKIVLLSGLRQCFHHTAVFPVRLCCILSFFLRWCRYRGCTQSKARNGWDSVIVTTQENTLIESLNRKKRKSCYQDISRISGQGELFFTMKIQEKEECKTFGKI